jgi:ubiquinone/menaquinone biosynthesis C-methylase UbiE
MPQEWWESGFDRNYIKIYSGMIDESVTNRQVVFIKKILKLKKGSKILDLACGYGRHSILLAKSGFAVTGFDYSETLLSVARKEARKQSVTTRFIQGDMRTLHLDERFDAVINLFTSFGYFKNKSDDELVLKNVYNILAPKGKFVIDLINPKKHLATAKAEGSYNAKSKSWILVRESVLPRNVVLTTRSEINPASKTWKMTRSWSTANKKFKYITSIRLYAFQEISGMLRKAGFTIQKTYGSFNSDPLSVDSKRMIIVARR